MDRWNRTTNGPTLRTSTVAVIGLVVLTVASLAFVASAQSRTAALAGTVQDPNGRRLPNVPVVLLEVGTDRKVEQQSNASGRFAFANLLAAEYRLKVPQSGFVSDQGTVKLVPGQHLERNLTLQVGSIAETIKVWLSVAQGKTSPAAPRSFTRPPAVDPCAPSAPAGCITPPEKRVDALPVYPPAHVKNAVSGQVIVVGRVGIDGRLEALEPGPDSDTAFTQATLEALKAWRYSPARLSGKPVTCRIVVTVIYGP